MFYYTVSIHDEAPVKNVAFGSMLRSDEPTYNLTFSFVFFLFFFVCFVLFSIFSIYKQADCYINYVTHPT